MFRTKTLFVVGAGANAGAGIEGLRMPTGAQLTEQIADLLNLSFEFGTRQISGDFVIVDVLRCLNGGGSTGRFGQAARFIKEAMPQAISIDNFIEAHRGNEAVELCGKLAIIRSILAAERAGPLYIDRRETGQPNFGLTSKTWLAEFFKTLTENVSRSELEGALANVGIICFNYDRCIEHYLVAALANYYGFQLSEAHVLVKNMQILHPYGTVGDLPWQASGHSPIDFGRTELDPERLSELVERIKTFSEQVEDASSQNRIRDLVTLSETVVFLGFAFHQPNMVLLKTPTASARRVFGTAYGFSETDRAEVVSELEDFFPNAKAVELNGQVRSHDFFWQYRRSLSAQ